MVFLALMSSYFKHDTTLILICFPQLFSPAPCFSLGVRISRFLHPSAACVQLPHFQRYDALSFFLLLEVSPPLEEKKLAASHLVDSILFQLMYIDSNDNTVIFFLSR